MTDTKEPVTMPETLMVAGGSLCSPSGATGFPVVQLVARSEAMRLFDRVKELEADLSRANARVAAIELAELPSAPQQMFRLQDAIHRNAVDHGWWEGRDISSPETIASCLCLVHSEISEALEEVRKGPEFLQVCEGEEGKPEGCIVEMADAVIRLFDLAGAMGLDLAHAIMLKHQYNIGRPYRHGGKAL